MADVVEKIHGADKFKTVEWASADLRKSDEISQAVKGCDYVIHCGSPTPGPDAPERDVMVKMAVGGIENILQACQEHKVKKLIITSSAASIQGGAFKRT